MNKVCKYLGKKKKKNMCQIKKTEKAKALRQEHA